MYSGFEVTCPDCDLQSALDHAARDKWASYFIIVRHYVFKIRIAWALFLRECSRNSNFKYEMTNYDANLSRAAWSSADFKSQSGQVTSKPLYHCCHVCLLKHVHSHCYINHCTWVTCGQQVSRIVNHACGAWFGMSWCIWCTWTDHDRPSMSGHTCTWTHKCTHTHMHTHGGGGHKATGTSHTRHNMGWHIYKVRSSPFSQTSECC